MRAAARREFDQYYIAERNLTQLLLIYKTVIAEGRTRG